MNSSFTEYYKICNFGNCLDQYNHHKIHYTCLTSMVCIDITLQISTTNMLGQTLPARNLYSSTTLKGYSNAG